VQSLFISAVLQGKCKTLLFDHIRGRVGVAHMITFGTGFSDAVLYCLWLLGCVVLCCLLVTWVCLFLR